MTTRSPLWLIGFLLVALSFVLPPFGTRTLWEAEAQSTMTPLQRLREQTRAGRPPALLLEGRVVAVTDSSMVTDIYWPSSGLEDDDNVTIRLGGRSFAARFLVLARYARLVDSPETRNALDVDIVCTASPDGALVIVGLAGGLSEWLRAGPGMPVAVDVR